MTCWSSGTLAAQGIHDGRIIVKGLAEEAALQFSKQGTVDANALVRQAQAVVLTYGPHIGCGVSERLPTAQTGDFAGCAGFDSVHKY